MKRIRYELLKAIGEEKLFEDEYKPNPKAELM